MRLIRIGHAAKKLGLDPDTLRRRTRGDWAEIYGHRIRAYPMDLGAGAERRYDADEIDQLLERLRSR
jgi:hypothetical protein